MGASSLDLCLFWPLSGTKTVVPQIAGILSSLG